MGVLTLLWCRRWDWQPLRVSYSSLQWCKLKLTYDMDTLQSFRHMHNNTSNNFQRYKDDLQGKWDYGTLWFVNLHINCMCVLYTAYDHLISKHAMFVNDFLFQISNGFAQNVWMVRMAAISFWRGVCLLVMAAFSKKASDNQFIGFWYARLHMYMLLNKSSCYFPPLCRGGPPGTKCPLQISEIITLT